jgi:hypothetical protein
VAAWASKAKVIQFSMISSEKIDYGGKSTLKNLLDYETLEYHADSYI